MGFQILRKKFLRNLRDYGFTVSLKKSLLYLLKPIYENQSFIIYVYKVDLANLDKSRIDPNDFTFRFVHIDDYSLINQIEDIDEWLQGRLKSLLLRGRKCMAVLNEDRVIGFYLASLDEVFIPLLSLSVILNSDEAWGEQITIRKDHRRKGLATELKNRIFRELKKTGIEKVFGVAAKNNEASLKSIEKFPHEILGELQYLKIFNFQRIKFKKPILAYHGETELVYKNKYVQTSWNGQFIFTAKTSDLDICLIPCTEVVEKLAWKPKVS